MYIPFYEQFPKHFPLLARHSLKSKDIHLWGISAMWNRNNLRRWDAWGNFQINGHQYSQSISFPIQLCNLFEPIMKAVEELNPDKKSSSLIKVNDILTVLSAGLFYRHMIKFNTQNPITKNLTNNRLTEINIKVITASVLVFASKKLRYKINDVV